MALDSALCSRHRFDLKTLIFLFDDMILKMIEDQLFDRRWFDSFARAEKICSRAQ
jgi:hypothetical protein